MASPKAIENIVIALYYAFVCVALLSSCPSDKLRRACRVWCGGESWSSSSVCVVFVFSVLSASILWGVCVFCFFMIVVRFFFSIVSLFGFFTAGESRY